MKQISEIIKSPTPKKSRHTEYGDLFDFFLSLGMKNSAGRLLSIGAIGMYLSPFIRPDKNYGLLYTLKKMCEQSDKPQAVFWMNVKPKKR